MTRSMHLCLVQGSELKKTGSADDEDDEDEEEYADEEGDEDFDAEEEEGGEEPTGAGKKVMTRRQKAIAEGKA